MVTAMIPGERARWKQLLALAWPMALASVCQAVTGFIDALMVAPLGKDALAAVGTGALNTLTISLLPMGLVAVVQTFSAQMYGNQDPAGARRHGWYGLLVAAACAALALLTIPLIPMGLSWFGFDRAVAELMTTYMSWRFVGLGAAVGVEALNVWYSGIGNTRIVLVTSVLMVSLDLGLNWVLIYGHLGAPALGVTGSALGTAIAAFVSLGFLILCFVRGSGIPEAGRRMSGRLSASELRRVLRIGLANSMIWFLDLGAITLFIDIVVGHLGTVVLAAMAVVVNINALSYMPAFGLGMAGGTLVGQAIGAKSHHEVPAIVRITVMAGIVWTGIIALVYLLLPGPLVSMFASADESSAQVLGVAATLLSISALWQIFDAIQMTLSEALRAAGDTVWSLWAHILVAWFVFVPGSFLAVLVFGGGYVVAMSCLIGYFILLGVVLWRRFHGGAWRRIDLLAAPHDSSPLLANATGE